VTERIIQLVDPSEDIFQPSATSNSTKSYSINRDDDGISPVDDGGIDMKVDAVSSCNSYTTLGGEEVEDVKVKKVKKKKKKRAVELGDDGGELLPGETCQKIVH
jgi:hypothetical protein